MDYLYVLKLEKEKWYVGRSANVERRYEQHLAGTGAKWTQLHKPLRLVLKRPLKDEQDENRTTQDFIQMYGANNVRGGSYCQVEPKSRCSRTVVQWSNYSQLNEADSGACFRCGRSSHWQRNCYATYNVDGDVIDSDSD